MSDRAPTYLPVIEKDDFQVFRRLMDREFQNKYRNWADWRAQHVAWADIAGEGQINAVFVSSKEFAAVERVGDDPASLNDLIDYAASVGEVSAA